MKMKSLSLIIVMENEILNHDNIIPPDFDDLNIMDALQEQDGRLENFEVEETSSEPEVMPDEEENVCKICRLPGEDSNPLYHPCKCSGSIRYVHEQCLLDWLKHSNNDKCELCKHVYKFTNIYRTNEEGIFPLVKSVLLDIWTSIPSALILILRLIIVMLVWGLAFPLISSEIWNYLLSAPSYSFFLNPEDFSNYPQWLMVILFGVNPARIIFGLLKGYVIIAALFFVSAIMFLHVEQVEAFLQQLHFIRNHRRILRQRQERIENNEQQANNNNQNQEQRQVEEQEEEQRQLEDDQLEDDHIQLEDDHIQLEEDYIQLEEDEIQLEEKERSLEEQRMFKKDSVFTASLSDNDDDNDWTDKLTELHENERKLEQEKDSNYQKQDSPTSDLPTEDADLIALEDLELIKNEENDLISFETVEANAIQDNLQNQQPQVENDLIQFAEERREIDDDIFGLARPPRNIPIIDDPSNLDNQTLPLEGIIPMDRTDRMNRMDQNNDVQNNQNIHQNNGPNFIENNNNQNIHQNNNPNVIDNNNNQNNAPNVVENNHHVPDQNNQDNPINNQEVIFDDPMMGVDDEDDDDDDDDGSHHWLIALFGRRGERELANDNANNNNDVVLTDLLGLTGNFTMVIPGLLLLLIYVSLCISLIVLIPHVIGKVCIFIYYNLLDYYQQAESLQHIVSKLSFLSNAYQFSSVWLSSIFKQNFLVPENYSQSSLLSLLVYLQSIISYFTTSILKADLIKFFRNSYFYPITLGYVISAIFVLSVTKKRSPLAITIRSLFMYVLEFVIFPSLLGAILIYLIAPLWEIEAKELRAPVFMIRYGRGRLSNSNSTLSSSTPIINHNMIFNNTISRNATHAAAILGNQVEMPETVHPLHGLLDSLVGQFEISLISFIRNYSFFLGRIILGIGASLLWGAFLRCLRNHLKPGTLWFLKFPGDPDFSIFLWFANNKMRTLLRKGLLSFVFHVSSLLLFVGLPTWLAITFLPTTFPFKLLAPTGSIQSQIDSNMLYLLIPICFKLLKPKVSLDLFIKHAARIISNIYGLETILLPPTTQQQALGPAENSNNQPIRFLKIRMTFAILTGCATLILIVFSVLTFPWVVGKYALTFFNHHASITDFRSVHTGPIGLFLILAFARLLHVYYLILAEYIEAKKRQQLEAIQPEVQDTEPSWFVDIGYIIRAAQVTWLLFLGVIVLPFLLGVFIRLSILNVQLTSHLQTPLSSPLHDYFFGLFALRMTRSLILIIPNNFAQNARAQAQNLNFAMLVNPPYALIMNHLVLPLITVVGTLLAVPHLFNVWILPEIGLPNTAKALLVKFSYSIIPTFLLLLGGLSWLITRIFNSIVLVVQGRQLVGRQIHNFNGAPQNPDVPIQ